jgi:hypothetical protein
VSHRTALLAASVAVAASVVIAAPAEASHAHPHKGSDNCVTNQEWNSFDRHEPVDGSTRGVVEKYWDARAVLAPADDHFDPANPRYYSALYQRCGFTIDKGWVVMVYRITSGTWQISVAWRALGAAPTLKTATQAAS